MPNMLIRSINTEKRDMIVQSAQARGMTLAEYFSALYELHIIARAHADGGNDPLQAELIALGLQTVTR